MSAPADAAGQRETIGFVGLGKMGLPMARRVREAGHAVVAFDMSAAALDEAAAFGAERADSPAEVGRRAGVVITMLPNVQVVRAAVLGENGVATTLPSGSLLIDMSSSSPQGTAELGAALKERGIALVDAPVSGGVPKARTGELAIMAGGDDPAAVERALPILGAMGRKIFRTGRLGSGQAMKALNNLVSAAGMVAAMEALLVGKKFGLEPALMVEILNGSTGRNNTTENKLSQFVLSGSYASGFGLDLQLKDVRTALELAGQLGLCLPVGAPTVEAIAAAAESLGPGVDHTAVMRHLEEKLGVHL